MIDPSPISIPKSLIGAELHEIAAWVVTTCLTFGASVSTSYFVAAYFVQVIEDICRRATPA
jgi:hypothetical protein